MLENLQQSFKAHLYERTTSPLFGAFSFSWVFWNYDTLLTVFSDWEPPEKIDYIQNVIYQGDLVVSIGHLLVCPLLSALAIIFIYPWPSRKAYTFWKGEQIKLHNERLKLEGKELVDQETYQKLKRNRYELEASYQKELDERDETIQTLKELVKNEQQFDDYEVFPAIDKEKSEKVIEDKSEIELNSTETKVLEGLAIKGSSSRTEDVIRVISQNNKLPITTVSYAVDTLSKKNLIRNSSGYVSLTFEGKKYAVEQGLVK